MDLINSIVKALPVRYSHLAGGLLTGGLAAGGQPWYVAALPVALSIVHDLLDRRRRRKTKKHGQPVRKKKSGHLR